MNDLDLSPSQQSQPSPQPVHAPSNRIPLSTRAEPLRIALAEDNGVLRRLLTLVLMRDGHDVVETRDATELLDLLAASYLDAATVPFDLVICEQSLPGLTGIAVLAGLRTRDRATPFILITGDEEAKTRARRLGAVVLDHPFTLAAIRRAIRQSAELPPPAND
jgi:two-component system, OmpR family, response regulator